MKIMRRERRGDRYNEEREEGYENNGMEGEEERLLK